MSNPNQVFNTVTFKKPKRSLQNLSNTYKSATDFGKIIPIGLYEIYPGDVMSKRTDVFLRSLALLAPMLHEVDVYVHDFFVPWRLIWDDYEKFLIPQDNETVETIPPKPYMQWKKNSNISVQNNPLVTGSLWDYFGLPLVSDTDLAGEFNSGTNPDLHICSLPFRAYQLIWSEYYRDQNLQDPFTLAKTSGMETPAVTSSLNTLRYRAWEKDYFTSSLPRPQKGEPIGIDISGVPGQRLNVQLDTSGDSASQLIKTAAGEGVSSDALGAAAGIFQDDPSLASPKNAFLDPNGTLFVSTAEENQGYFTIEMLREAMRLQEFMEQLMRGGSRYAEVVRNMFGQVPDDLRVGRPAYLGGSRQPINISEVLQQSQSVEADQSLNTSALGDMAGHGVSIPSGKNRWKALFKEHGYVLSLMSIRPRSAYMQGVNKLWLKDDRYEEMWPLFAHLGEQPVMNGELYWSWLDGKNRDTFGYQPIYTEMRTKPSIVTGDLRGNLDFWHLNRKFSGRPVLNADFITCQPSQNNRIFATESGDHFVFEVANDVKMIRCIPRDGNPTL